MVLVDTSIWIDFLDDGNEGLQQLLQADSLMMHPAIIGEIALGNLKNRQSVLASLHRLPFVLSAKDAEALALIEARKLAGTGIGYTDTLLIASTLMTPHCKFWTRDKRLDSVSRQLGIAWQPLH